MEHFYESIPGWFDFQYVYEDAVNKAPQVAHFVEIGSWLGRSTAALAVWIVNSGKSIRLDAIDTFRGSPGEQVHADVVREHGGSVRAAFEKNTRPVHHIVRTVEAESVEAAKHYADESLDFVFIDASHSYAAVTADIQAWWPKIKRGGTIGGHDYTQNNEVVRAVDDYFGPTVEFVAPQAWRVRKT